MSRVRASAGQAVGLTAASTALMFGIVLAVNAGMYGWTGVAGGAVLALAAGGVMMRFYQQPSSDPQGDDDT